MTVTKRLRSLVAWITVEPVEFLYCLMFTTSNVVRDSLFNEKVCRLDLNYTEEICYQYIHNANLSLEITENIQDRVAELEMWDGIIVALPSTFFCLFVGNWSDYHGRKLLLVLPFIGNILSYIAYMLNYYFFYELGTDHLLWGSIVGISGAYQCLNIGLYGYVSDVTSLDDRTMRLSILNGVFSLGYVIGTTLGSMLYKYVENYYVVFGTSCGIGILGILYTLIFIQESVHSSAEVRKQHRLLDINNVKATFVTTFKKRPDNGRLRICLLIFNFAVFMFCLNTSRYDFLLTVLKFDWSFFEYSNYLSVQRICRMLSLFILLPFLSKVVHMNDALVACLSTICSIAAYLIIAVAPKGGSGWIMYLSAALQLNSLITVIIRAQCTKSVEPVETGRIFAAVALAQSLVPLVANPLFGLVYKATLDTFPGAYLLIVDGLLVMAFFSSAFLFWEDRKASRRHKQEKEAKPEIQ